MQLYEMKQFTTYTVSCKYWNGSKLTYLSVYFFPESLLRGMSDVKLKIKKTDGGLKPQEQGLKTDKD